MNAVELLKRQWCSGYGGINGFSSQDRDRTRKISNGSPLKNGRLVNVFSGEIHDASVAVCEGIIAGFGEYQHAGHHRPGGGVSTSGFYRRSPSHRVEHAEHSGICRKRATSWHYRGCGGLPHEIANVLGVDGIRYMLDSSAKVPLQGIRDVSVLRSGYPFRDFRRGADP